MTNPEADRMYLVDEDMIYMPPGEALKKEPTAVWFRPSEVSLEEIMEVLAASGIKKK